MACNRQIEKVTYDLGCQVFSLLGEGVKAFPNESMGSEGKEVKLKFSGGGKESKILVGEFLCTKRCGLDVCFTYFS